MLRHFKKPSRWHWEVASRGASARDLAGLNRFSICLDRSVDQHKLAEGETKWG
ncbi:hypothetical protein NXC14_CH00299 [Rhizobium sp. NXC14]|nr:hypothetical protein NXC14_CH00299 [Rhizobium sp. NXC14]